MGACIGKKKLTTEQMEQQLEQALEKAVLAEATVTKRLNQALQERSEMKTKQVEISRAPDADGKFEAFDIAKGTLKHWNDLIQNERINLKNKIAVVFKIKAVLNRLRDTKESANLHQIMKGWDTEKVEDKMEDAQEAQTDAMTVLDNLAKDQVPVESSTLSELDSEQITRNELLEMSRLRSDDVSLVGTIPGGHNKKKHKGFIPISSMTKPKESVRDHEPTVTTTTKQRSSPVVYQSVPKNSRAVMID